MNTYGHTLCPVCFERNNMFRPLDLVKEMPAWNEVKCWNCKHEYQHTNELEATTHLSAQSRQLHKNLNRV